MIIGSKQTNCGVLIIATGTVGFEMSISKNREHSTSHEVGALGQEQEVDDELKLYLYNKTK